MSQGQVRFLLNSKEDSYAGEYLKKHDEGVSKISFEVENVELALNEAINRGAELFAPKHVDSDDHGEYITAQLKGLVM